MNYSLVVFDLDFTLWNAGGTWCDHTWPPYRRVDNHIQDSEDNILFLYPNVKEILEELSQNYTLAVASRTGQPTWAIELMTLFDIRHLFKYTEIYPGSKIEHFNHLHAKSGIPFHKMIFFDDEMRNVDEVRSLDVDTILVDKGITRELVNRHLEL